MKFLENENDSDAYLSRKETADGLKTTSILSPHRVRAAKKKSNPWNPLPCHCERHENNREYSISVKMAEMEKRLQFI
jgi:hypothetical protein